MQIYNKLLLNLCLVLLLILAVCFSACAPKPVNLEGTSTSTLMDSAQIFASNCAECHGANRLGLKGPELTPTSLSNRSISWLTSRVNHSGRLTETQVPIMADFLKNTPP